MRETTAVRHLQVRLTEEQLAEKAQELAESVKEEEKQREAFAAWDDTMKRADRAAVDAYLNLKAPGKKSLREMGW